MLDGSNPAALVEIGSYEPTGAHAGQVIVAGRVAFVADRYRGLELVDVADPARPGSLGRCDQPPYADALAVSGAYVYLAAGSYGMRVIDVRDTARPRQVSIYDTQSYATSVAVADGYAFVATTNPPDARRGLHIVDVRNPRECKPVGRAELPGAFAEAVTVSDGRVTVAAGGAGVFEFKTTRLADPTERRLLATPGCALEVKADARYVYVADFDAGLVIRSRDTEASAAGGAGQVVAAVGSSHPPVRKEGFWGLFSSAKRDHREVPAAPPPHAGRIHSQGGNGPRLAAVSTCQVSTTRDEGPGTLRWCLENIGDGGTITFDVLVFPPERPATIAPLSPLPALERNRVVVDGSNAAVILDGSGSPPGTYGLVLRSEGCVIRGLQIVRFPKSGIHFEGGRQTTIGGDRARGRGPTGEGNLISANGEDGINLCGQGSYSNTIVGNLIGTDANGRAAWPNRRNGIFICAGASRNRVGGFQPSQWNLVSGNLSEGIVLAGAETRRNVIAGNLIGTDLSGTSPIPNAGNGIFLLGPENIVGGSSAAERNLISGNQVHGVGFIGRLAFGNQVIGNWIGCDLTGSRLLTNGDHGVALEMGANNNVVKDNVIVTSGRNAIINDWGSSYNTIVGNLLGTDALGTRLLARGFNALQLGMGASFNRIGGTAAADRNVIVGGVYLGRHLGPGNLILGNYLGLDYSGRTGIGEGPALVLGNGSRRVVIGGATAEEANIISSGPRGSGIQLDPYVDDAFIGSNRIGTDAAGVAAVGNAGDGVVIADGECNIIQGNLIAHHTGAGIRIRAGSFNVIRSNSITDNRGPGIVLESGANRLIAAPTMSVASNSILGLACPGCEVEIFSDQ